MSKHTPTPWLVSGKGDNNLDGPDFDNGRSVINEDGWHIAHCWNLDDEAHGINPLANAAHIVKCVNERDELVAALADLLFALNTAEAITGNSGFKKVFSKSLEQARAALARAKS